MTPLRQGQRDSTLEILAGLRARNDALEAALRQAREALKFGADTLQEPLAELVRLCRNEKPHNHNMVRALWLVTKRLETSEAAIDAALEE